MVLCHWGKVRRIRALRKVRVRGDQQSGARAAVAGAATSGLGVRDCPALRGVCARAMQRRCKHIVAVPGSRVSVVRGALGAMRL